MRYVELWIILSLLLSCCVRPKQTTSGQRELVPNPEKYEQDFYDPDAIHFVPDTSIGPISLLNQKNVPSFLGGDIMERVEGTTTMALPHTAVLSSDKSQQLTVIFHPGSVKNEFSEFIVQYAEEGGRKNYPEVSAPEFITESGVKLGMTQGALKALKGEPDTVIVEELPTLQYVIDDYENSPFLEAFAMPLYYAHYTFKEGYLIKFQFGFEYP